MPAQAGMPCPLAGCEVTLEKAEFTNRPLANLFGPVPPDPGTRYALFTIRVRNTGSAPVQWGFDRFNPALQTSGSAGQVIRGANLLTGGNDKFEKQPIQPGEEKTLRFHFQVPLGARLTTLSMGESASRPQYLFGLTSVE
jgi:hypothetical protein